MFNIHPLILCFTLFVLNRVLIFCHQQKGEIENNFDVCERIFRLFLCILKLPESGRALCQVKGFPGGAALALSAF